MRIAGVEVGKVKQITFNAGRNRARRVLAPTIRLSSPRAPGAAIRYDNLIGERYLALEEGAGGVKRSQPGQTIPA